MIPLCTQSPFCHAMHSVICGAKSGHDALTLFYNTLNGLCTSLYTSLLIKQFLFHALISQLHFKVCNLGFFYKHTQTKPSTANYPPYATILSLVDLSWLGTATAILSCVLTSLCSGSQHILRTPWPKASVSK